MKRVIKVFLFVVIFSINTYASSGPIKQDSIIECNNKYYGNHGNPVHWHQVEKKDGKWVSISGEVEIPACYIKKVNEKELVTLAKCGDGDTARFIINNTEVFLFDEFSIIFKSHTFIEVSLLPVAKIELELFSSQSIQ